MFTLSVLTSPNASAGEFIATPDQIDFFEKEVRPLFAQHCYSCHSVGAKKIQAGLKMDSRAALLAGGDSGEAIVPGDAEASLLIEAVRYESYEMPPKGELPEKDVATLERWVEMGAPWPQEEAPVADADRPEFDLHQRKSDHWVWQPILPPAIPNVVNHSWPLDPLDRFVISKLEKFKLAPATDTDRTALMRRLYFDLIGLPPSPDQAAAFLNNDSSQATEQLVDELLDSPHFGERWGRHWLDLVRYAESRGHEYDPDIPNAFQYRDYIIRAFNADVPYDQLVREHIAGDLLPTPRLNPATGFNESILGTGFWYLGEWAHSPVDIRKDESDRFDNMIDVMSKTFLGVTVSCARCHDHKFDAISTADYYSLTGFLQSSDYRQVRFESIEQNRSIAKQLVQVDAKYQQQIRDLLDAQGVAFPQQTIALDDDAIVVDFGDISQTQLMQDGFIFGETPQRAGTAYFFVTKRRGDELASVQQFLDRPETIQIATYGAAVNDPFWDGLKSINEGVVQNKNALAKIPMSGRALHTPTFELKDAKVSCLVEGKGHIVACVDSHRQISGPLHKQTIQPVTANKQKWVTFDLDRYLGHRLHLEFVPAKQSRLAVRMVTQGLEADGLADIEKQLAASDESFARYAATAERILKTSEQRKNKANDNAAAEIVRAWQTERQKLSSQLLRDSRLAPAMMDGTGEDDRVLIRGNSSKPGDLEPRHFLTAITGNHPMPIKQGSGRFELAAEINDRANPLTSRVIVNRIWHHLIGRGIVATTDDFGVLGQRPTHPELLDHLATRFAKDGRSIKRMIRTIALSRTYRMSSHSDPTAVDVDPKNLLWHHRPPKRLDGEAIRDALLTLSGRLDATQFGASVPVHLTAFMEGRGRPRKNGPLDGDGRRSIYTSVRRNFLSPFMTTFDSPTPFSTMGRRNVSNVPAQALILMNDPLVVELASKWAERGIKKSDAVESRIHWMYQTAFARQPTSQEQAIAVGYINAQSSKAGIDKDNLALWSDFAHALINTKEFTFLR